MVAALSTPALERGCMSNRRMLILAITLSILLSACSNDDGGGPPAANTGVSALFSTDPLDVNNPFPTDRLLDGSGHVRVPSAIIEKILPDEPRFAGARTYLRNAAAELQSLTGFSIFAPIRVVLDGAVELDRRIDPRGVFLLRQDEPSESIPVRVDTVTPEISGDYAIEIGPLVPLAPKRRYVYAVTNDVRDADGNPLRAPSLLPVLLCGNPRQKPLAAWRAALEPALAFLEDEHGVACEDIAMIDVFTTQPTADDLIAIRDLFDTGVLPYADPAIEDSPVANLETGIFEEGTPQFEALVGSPTSDAIRAVAIGSFPSYEFRGAGRVFDPDRVAGTETPPVVHLDFYVAFPKAPPPPGGYPLIVYGHGLSRSGADAITTATSYPDLPMVWAGVSAVSHGRRGNFLSFFNLANVLATRDNFRQTIADFMQFQRMIRHTDHPLFEDIDRERIEYYGVSLGGILGTLFMGIESDVRVGVLNVPGGGLPNILAGSDFIGELINPLIALQLGIAIEDPLFPTIQHTFLQLAQWTLDPGDPISTAPYLLGPETLPGVPPKTLLMQMGISDTIVPNNTSEDLARAMRIADVKKAKGCADDDGCSGIWRYVMTDYDQPSDCGHLISFVVEESHRQALSFLFNNGTEIEDASPRIAPEDRPECPELTGIPPG
jgi:hypothetical protein